MHPIYLDYNATTPIDPAVAEAMHPYLSAYFGNPSSGHWYGTQAKQAVEQARQQVAALLHCQSDEIVFTSGGSEANNMAIKGIALAHRSRGNHIITSTIEHPAVIEVCKHLATQGFDVTYLPVNAAGMVERETLVRAMRPQTILLTIMHANNEVGTIQPIADLARLAQAHGIIVHTDAAQSVGKIPTDVATLGVDLLSVAGHKLYAPKGVGALYIRRGLHLEKLIHGADHERGWRAGTENVLEIVGLGQACAIAQR
jgi:cysteine sulfinate desulfinase/cysteine desulfurase-like protein